MKSRFQSRLQAVLPSIKACFSVPALVASAALSWSLPANAVTETFSTAGTFEWICPPGVTSVSVAVQGGGGGGGGSTASNNRMGAGGGGGGCAYSPALTVVPGTVYTVVVGAGGTAGDNTSGTGGTGGSSSFSGGVITTLTASGGGGGGLGSTGTGGAGGTATGGTVNFFGGTGANGAAASLPISAGAGAGGAGTTGNGGLGSGATGGAGGAGSPAGGAGGNSPTTQAVGRAGAAPGGGGSGGCKGTTSSQKGGAGGRGQVTLTYTDPGNYKANNTDPLNLASSWSVDVPVNNSANPAIWDNHVLAANTTLLGSDLTFSGIQILDPGGLVTINAGNTLTIGSAATDLDLSAATQDLTLNCDVAMGAANVWNTDLGRTLVLGGNVSGTATVTKQGDGTAVIAADTSYLGSTTVNAGTLAWNGNRTTNMGGLLDLSPVSGANVILDINGDMPMGSQQFRPGSGTGTATVNHASGALTFTSGNQITLGTTSTAQGFYNLIGGSITTASQANRGLLIGVNASCYGEFSMTAGSLDVVTGSSLHVCRSENVAATGATGIFNQSGGIATVADLRIGGSAATNNANQTATVNLSGGTFTATGFTALSGGDNSVSTINISGTADVTLAEFPTARGAGATATLTFDGGTLKNAAPTANFISGLTEARIKAGGATIDTTNGDATIAQALVEDGVSTGGGLTKTGLKSLTLSGANTYTGGSQVNGGSLKFDTAVASTTNINVASGAEAGAFVSVSDGQWVNTGDLTLQNGGGVVVDYGSTAPSTTVAPISVTNFTFGTSPGVRLISNPGSALMVGQVYPVVTWSGTGPVVGTGFSSLTHRLGGTFSVSSNTLFFTVTSNTAGAPISWNTGDGSWDTSTANWVDSDLNSTPYFDSLDSVVLGDAAGVTGNPVVTLGVPFSPLAVTMNSTAHDYTVSGAGMIGGSGSLTLDAANTRTLTLATAGNMFTGGTTINGGTLALGAATDTLLDTGAVMVDGASAVLSLGANSDTVGAVSLKNGASITGTGGTLTGASYAVEDGTISANLGGGADLIKTTAGTVTLAGDNSAGTGRTTINEGTVLVTNPNALNTTGVVGISSTTGSGTLHLATDSSVNAFRLNGSSNNPGTVIVDRATPGAGFTHLSGAAVLGNNLWTVAGGGNVTSGTPALSIASLNIAGGNAGTCTINPTTASVLIPGAVNIGSSNFAKTLALSGDSTGNEISGEISDGLNTVSVRKLGASTWTLSGANSYTGTTTIEQGTLAFATTDQSLTGGLTFGSADGAAENGTLDLSTASATFAGAALVRTNSTTPNSITIGATEQLTLNGNLTLGYDAAGGTGQTESMLTATGAGSMAVNGTTINVSANQAGQNQAYWSKGTLDVSGLAAFSANVTNFNIGVGTTTQGPGTVLLSDTANTIIATSLKAGDTGGNNGRGTGLLVLGTGTNVIQADTITIGRSKSVPGGSTGRVQFASQTPGSPGTVTIADTAGTGRANIDIANQGATATGGGATGDLDLSGHVATVSAETVAIGTVSAASNSGGPNGTLSFDAGTFDVNTLTMGTKSGNSTGTARATVNIGGGTFTVNTAFNMGSQTGNGASEATVNLTGGTLTSAVSIVKGAGNTTSTINLQGGTLDLNGNAIGSGGAPIVLNAESGTLMDVATINGTGGLTKTTAGTVIVEGTDSYSGDTTVSEGILTLSDAAGPGNANTINDASIVSIAATGATLDLAYTGTDVVNELYLGGVLQVAGIWGAVGSGAPNTDSRITGTGTLTVSTGAVGGYTTWAATNAGGQAADLDFDNDGTSNGIEYFMNAAAGFTANPQLNGSNTITWTNGGNIPASAYGTQFVVQTSPDLGNWTDVPSGQLLSNTDGPGGSLTYQLTGPAPRFVRLVVTP